MRYSEYKMYESLLKDNKEKCKKIDEKKGDPVKELTTVVSFGLVIL